MDKKEFYNSINGLRAYSAIGILMMHVLANGQYDVNGFLFDNIISSFGNLVLLFMIVSAFSMCCGYYEKITKNQISLERFYSKRFEKVWPFFALLCLIDFVVSPSINSVYEIFANLTLCFGLLPNAGISVIGVGWFLGVVFVFYFLFPFFCYLISNKKRAWFSFAAALIFNYLCEIRFDAGSSNIVYSAVFFLAGGLIYLYRERLCRVVGNISNPVRGVISLIGIILMVWIYANWSDCTLAMLGLFSVMLIWALKIGGGNNRVLSNPITNFLSSISLEIYLSHMVIYRVLEKVGLPYVLGNGVVAYIVTVVMTLFGTIIFSVVSKRLLERIVVFLKSELYKV